ncbi:MAG: cytidylate kinase-like family protein [Aggregatilineales bacterium]
MPTITVTRHHGCGGHQIATRVRDILGYRFFDSPFLKQIASEVGLSREEAVDFSEEDYKVKTFLERLISFNPAEMRISPSSVKEMHLDVPRFDDADSVDLVKLLVHFAYEHSNVVIVGRGAQVILRNQPNVLHVRIIAPVDTRLKNVQETEGLSLEAARQYIEERDKSAREYLARFFNTQWDDPYLYHLTINTGYCEIEPAAQLIVAAVQQLVGAKAP